MFNTEADYYDTNLCIQDDIISWEEIIFQIYGVQQRKLRNFLGADGIQERLFGDEAGDGLFLDNRRGERVESESIETEYAINAYLESKKMDDFVEAILEIADLKVQEQILLFFSHKYSQEIGDDWHQERCKITNTIRDFLQQISDRFNSGYEIELFKIIDPMMRAKYSIRAKGKKDKNAESALAKGILVESGFFQS